MSELDKISPPKIEEATDPHPINKTKEHLINLLIEMVLMKHMVRK